MKCFPQMSQGCLVDDWLSSDISSSLLAIKSLMFEEKHFSAELLG